MNLIDTIKHLTKTTCLLSDSQGRIARRNARRKVMGALRAVRYALDSEFPAVPKPAALKDPVDVAAATMGWRQFEYGVIAHLRLEWDLDLATDFNIYCAKVFNVTPKPVRVHSGIGRFIGQHSPDEISLNTGLDREEKWRTLMHEIAHYRVSGHRRSFVLELAKVYKLWLTFRLSLRVAAKTLPD